MTFQALPWPDYPLLTSDCFQTIAGLIRDEHALVAALFDPNAGDSVWDRGCRAYSRRCNAIRRALPRYNWLTVPSGNAGGLEFTFAIRGIPIKTYCGDADAVPLRYQTPSFPEFTQQQLAFNSGEVPSQNTALRLAIENAANGEVLSIMLVEVDTSTGDTIRAAEIPIPASGAAAPPIPSGPVTPFGGQQEGVILPPATVEPIDNEAEGTQADGAE